MSRVLLCLASPIRIQPTCAHQPPSCGECGSPGISDFWWWMRWVATQKIGPPSNVNAPQTANNKKLLKELEPERQRLNALEALDYEAVMQAKLGFLKKIFPSQKAATFRAQEYKKFFATGKSFLVPYAAF